MILRFFPKLLCPQFHPIFHKVSKKSAVRFFGRHLFVLIQKSLQRNNRYAAFTLAESAEAERFDILAFSQVVLNTPAKHTRTLAVNHAYLVEAETHTAVKMAFKLHNALFNVHAPQVTLCLFRSGNLEFMLHFFRCGLFFFGAPVF